MTAARSTLLRPFPGDPSEAFPVEELHARLWLAELETPMAHLRLRAVPAEELSDDGVALVGELLASAVNDSLDSAGQASTAVRSRQFAGCPALSITSHVDDLPGLVRVLRASVLDHGWTPDEIRFAADGVAAKRARATPRLRARELCRPVSEQTDLASAAVATLSYELSIVVDLAARPGWLGEAGDPPDLRYRRPTLERTTRIAGRTEDAQTSWLAYAWDIECAGAADCAAVQAMLFALGGTSSWLYRQLRDRHGISYGPRTNAQVIGPGWIRCWLEVSVPVAMEQAGRDIVAEACSMPDQRLVHECLDVRDVLVTAGLSALDTPAGQADALCTGRAAGGWSQSWDVVTALRELDAATLTDRVEQRPLSPALAALGAWRS